MQAGAQNEVSIQQRTRLAKKSENIVAHSLVGRFCETPLELASDTDALQSRLLISILARRSNNFDFHICALGQRRHLDGRTGWRILLEIRTINFVNGLKIAKIREENRCLNHLVES